MPHVLNTDEDAGAAHILASMATPNRIAPITATPNEATPTTSAFSHFRNMSLDQPMDSASKPDRPQPAHIPKIESLFEALIQHEDVLLYITTQFMEPGELFILYCMSRPFHMVVNANLTSYMLCSARRWARISHTRPSNEVPEPSRRDLHSLSSTKRLNTRRYFIDHMSASRKAMQACGTEPTPPGIYSPHDITTVLPFHNFLFFCRADRPDDRQWPWNHSKGKATSGSNEILQRPPRFVPTFRYLKFVLSRARMAQSIIGNMLKEGHRLPLIMASVLVKLELCVRLPLNKQRLSIFRNTTYITNKDLYIALLFMVKLDMNFTDPVDGTGETSLRKLSLSFGSLDTLEAVLDRRDGRDMLEIMQLWIRVNYKPPLEREEELQDMTVMGIPWEEQGTAASEGFGMPLGVLAARRARGEGRGPLGAEPHERLEVPPPSVRSHPSTPQTSHHTQGRGSGPAMPPSQSASLHQRPWAPRSSTPQVRARQQQPLPQQPPTVPHSQAPRPSQVPPSSASRHLQVPQADQPSQHRPPPLSLSNAQPSTSNYQSNPSSTIQSPQQTRSNTSQTTNPNQQAPSTHLPTSQFPSQPTPGHPTPRHEPTSQPSARPPTTPALNLHPHPHKRAHLLRPDELLVGECVRRGLPLHTRVLDMMLYGYVDVRTGENLPRTEGERAEMLGRRGWYDNGAAGGGSGGGEEGGGEEAGANGGNGGEGKGDGRRVKVEVEDGVRGEFEAAMAQQRVQAQGRGREGDGDGGINREEDEDVEMVGA